MAAPLKQRRAWSDDDVARLIRMREVERKSWPEIDRVMGRTLGGSHLKYRALKAGQAPRMGSVEGGRVVLSPDQEASQRARKDAENRMSLTATLCGDPPPGYSALDRRGQ